jgi:hypothetical protein
MVRTYEAVDSTFEFDVVNLDFITTPFPGMESPLEGTWGSIQKLLQVQRSHNMDFDLFLTFRGSPTNTNASALDEIAELLARNFRDHRGDIEFQARFGHLNPARLLRENYLLFLCMGLPKLLIADAIQKDYMVSRYDIYTYPREGGDENYHIVKFVFSFEVPRSNAPLFAASPQLLTNYDEAVPRLFRTNVVDVGDILTASPLLNDELMQEIEVLDRLVIAP